MSRYRCLKTTSAPLFAGILITLAFGGCSNTKATSIEARDYTVPLGELKIAYNFDRVKEAATPHTGHAIELGATTGSGSASQSLPSGQMPILLDNTTFTAPQELRNEFRFVYRELLWRYRVISDNQLGVEVSAGVGEALIDLKVSSATQVAAEQFKESGIRIGGGLIYPLSPSSSFQARGLLFKSLDSRIGRAELVYAKTFFNNFRLHAGFAGGEIAGYNYLRSDYSLKFFGPILALNLEF